MPSFDIVSEVDMHEVSNSVDQANREVGNRFDFKGTSAKVEQKDALLIIRADNAFQADQVLDILYKKLAKRNIDVAALDKGEIQTSGNKASMEITVRQGIDQETAKKLIKQIKESKKKVQSSIQGEKIRVTGKKRDVLQEIISMLGDSGAGLPLQYINFRD
jgi:uncharacterized protein YajQ (UPF0234 family)